MWSKCLYQSNQNDKTSYSHNKGLFETRQCQYFKRKYDFFYSEEEIIVTNGASEALDTSLLLNGDDILIQDRYTLVISH